MSAPLSPLSLPQRLAPTPHGPPRYAVEVPGADGKSWTLADPRAIRALLALMNQHAVNGGAACHWGGPSALAELMSSLFSLMFADKKTPWWEHFHFINDVGHAENGLYALRALWGFDHMNFEQLRDFRGVKSKLTGHGEAHLNPQQILLSNGPLGSSLAQAQGLCFADRLLKKKRTTVMVLSDGAAMEGEAKEAMSAIPGLALKGKMNPFVMVVSDNNTKLSGRIDKDAFSMAHSFQAMEVLGWRVLALENGHDLKSCLVTWQKALDLATQDPTRPVCIWAKTVKGFGVKSTSESASGGHGFPLKKHDSKMVEFIQEIYQGEAPSEFVKWAQELQDLGQKNATQSSSTSLVKKEKIQVGVAQAMIETARAGLPVVSVSADLQGSTGVAPFHKEFPERSFDVGVAESNMVSMAAGLSKAGLIAVVDTFAQFGVTKGNLPLTMAVLSEAPVIGIFSHTGFQDAADGASHQATTYVSATASIPYTEVIALSCSQEAKFLVGEAIRRFPQERKNYLFFLGREDFPAHYQEGDGYEWGKAQVLTQGAAAVVVTCGSLVVEALEAAKILEKDGIMITVINSSFINHPDVETIATHLKKAGAKLVTVEDHQVVAGMGSILVHALTLRGEKFAVKSLGIQNAFGQSAYKSSELYQKHGLDREAIARAVRAMK